MSDRESRRMWREISAPSRWTPYWPKLYRYRVADPVRFRPKWNRYPDHAPIGFAVTLGRWAYCVKWAHLRAAGGRRAQ